MHTFSVLVLGLVLFKVSRSVSVEQIYPQLTVASGVLAMSFGAWLLWTRARAMAPVVPPLGVEEEEEEVILLDHHVSGSAHDGSGHPATTTRREPVAARRVAAALDVTGHRTDRSLVEPEPSGAAASQYGGTTSQEMVPAHPDHLHASHDHSDHGHDHIGHGHGHSHGNGHSHGPGGHTHELPADVAPLSRRGLIVLATSGGIVPSPSAVIVVVSAFSIGRVPLGLSLIAAFSIGLAVTLTAIGLALVFGRTLIDRRWPNRSFRYLPLFGAAALILAGAVLAVRGLTGLA